MQVSNEAATFGGEQESSLELAKRADIKIQSIKNVQRKARFLTLSVLMLITQYISTRPQEGQPTLRLSSEYICPGPPVFQGTTGVTVLYSLIFSPVVILNIIQASVPHSTIYLNMLFEKE